jgi:stearoyl-CoA desaturase (delta-9 desaturase)
VLVSRLHGTIITEPTAKGEGPQTLRIMNQPLANGRSFNWRKSLPFMGVHLVCLALIFTGVTTFDLILCAALYLIRMFGITGGYHRYFAHRSYKTSRVFQFVLAWLGCSALQKGPLWWAGHHRHHHLYSDTEEDVHSPVVRSLWWSHLGWILGPDYEKTDLVAIRDFVRFPELRWLNDKYWVPGILLGVLCFLLGGWSGLLCGFFLSTVLLYHGTFCINSLCHIFGTKRFATADQSRNNFWLALITLGEGWHNNHHHYQSSANQGFYWWEIDISYYVIRCLGFLGLVWDIRKPPQKVLDQATRS